MDRYRLEAEIEELLAKIKYTREQGRADKQLEAYTLGMKRALELVTGKEYTVYDFELQEVYRK